MIDEVQKTVDELYARVWNQHNEGSQPTDIFHYTSAQGLCGILHEKVFFASDLFCLNDPSEFQYGKSIVMKVLTSRSDPMSRSLLDNFKEDPLFPRQGKEWSAYSVSFCGTKDLLGQWHGYGGPGGYAIGARLSALMEHARHRIGLIRMLYDHEKQVEVIDRFLSGAVEIFERNTMRVHADELLTEVGTCIIRCIFNFKHPAFRGEDEWRILMIEDFHDPNFPVKYRISGNRIVPYIELPFETHWVSRVILGPTVPSHPNILAIKRMLSIGEYTGVECEPSDIPFRD
jgi:hypothetical protein